MNTVLIPDSVEAFTAMADPTRSRILKLLATRDRCVCHLVDDLELGQSIVSHHVGVLRRSGLITSYPHPRDRRWMYYRLDRDRIEQIGTLLLNLSSSGDYNPDPLPCPIDLEEESE